LDLVFLKGALKEHELPTLKLTGDFWDSWIVYAAMLFPEDDKLHDAYLIRERVRIELEEAKRYGLAELPFSIELVEKILNGPSHGELRKSIDRSVKEGSVAGDMLNHVYVMHITRQKEPSLKKAIHLQTAFSKETKYGDGSKLPSSDTRVRSHWEKYQSVAHIWGAFRLCKDISEREKIEERRFLWGDHLPYLLSYSEILRKFATTFIPARQAQNKPLITKKTWKTPANYVLPETTIEIESIPDWIIEALKKYRAPTPLPE
jgi:asparagine synthetase B (glutamine-hydrolysing)